jgi:hypothetical protein
LNVMNTPEDFGNKLALIINRDYYRELHHCRRLTTKAILKSLRRDANCSSANVKF